MIGCGHLQYFHGSYLTRYAARTEDTLIVARDIGDDTLYISAR